MCLCYLLWREKEGFWDDLTIDFHIFVGLGSISSCSSVKGFQKCLCSIPTLMQAALLK